MVDTVDTDTEDMDLDMVITLERGLLMLSQKANHGIMAALATDMPTVILFTIMVITLERDLLMLNQKANHGMDMAADTVDTDVEEKMDMEVTDMENKTANHY